MRPDSLLNLLGSLGLGPDNAVAGTEHLGRAVEHVRLHRDGRLAVGSIAGSALVFTEPPDVGLDLHLNEFRAAGAVALFLQCEPSEVLASTRWLADRLSLPIIVCPGADPLDLAFRLKRAVSDIAVEIGTSCAAVSSQLHGKPCDPDRAVSILRGALGIETAVVGADGIILAGAPSIGRLALPEQPHARIDVDADGRRVFVPVSASSSLEVAPDCWLVADLGVTTRARAETVRAALQLVSTALTAWIAVNRLEARQDAHLKASVLMEVLTEADTLSPLLLERALSLGWSLSGWHIPVCLRTTQPLDGSTTDAQTPRVAAALRAADSQFEIVRSGTGWLAWTSQRSEPTPTEMDAMVAAIRRTVDSLGHRLVAGVGSARRGARGFADGLLEAQALAGAAGWTAGRKVVEDARTSPPRRLVLQATRGADVAAFSEQLLRPVLTADEALLETLETYLAMESSKAETARALHTHRNTIVKRLDRISALLGLDLDDPEVRLALEIALRADTSVRRATP